MYDITAVRNSKSFKLYIGAKSTTYTFTRPPLGDPLTDDSGKTTGFHTFNGAETNTLVTVKQQWRLLNSRSDTVIDWNVNATLVAIYMQRPIILSALRLRNMQLDSLLV